MNHLKKILNNIQPRDVYSVTGGFIAGAFYMAWAANPYIKGQEKRIENALRLAEINHEAILKFIKETDAEVWMPIAKQVLTDYEFQDILMSEGLS